MCVKDVQEAWEFGNDGREEFEVEGIEDPDARAEGV
jgi:hypothetical protein